jgi:hypothetical protein
VTTKFLPRGQVEKKKSAVVTGPDDARDPLIERYIRGAFGRRVNEPDEWGHDPCMESAIRGD